ncbi:MAG: hypothetical protein RR550_01015 [Rikenellaceae bacterium]
MIIAGIVIGLLFDGVELFRRYSNQITGHLMQSNTLLITTNWLTAITESCDSIRQEQDVKMYRKGAVHTTITLSDSLLTINNDTLPIKISTLSVRVDTLVIETEQLTLYFPIRRKPETEVMKQIEKEEEEFEKRSFS